MEGKNEGQKESLQGGKEKGRGIEQEIEYRCRILRESEAYTYSQA
jgi:hypothetical protein